MFNLRTFILLLITSAVTSQKKSIPKRHVIKTIQVKGGDEIDCIDIYKQPAFNHPALKNHKIQMKSNHLHPTADPSKKLQDSNSSKKPSQVWRQYGSCPNGTIPTRRPSNDHQTNIHPRKSIATPNHSFSVVVTEGFKYTGAQASIKVWNPFVESNNEYSSSQVMLRTGPLKSFETAEAGWAVNPIVYNDTKTRFFAYWTVDGMRNTGCFDLTCPGFVQTSGSILLGGDISDYYGSEISIHISLDVLTSNWWLKFNDEEVGYWPGDIFPLMKYQAVLVQWGGEVYSQKVGTRPHTATAMGSGQSSDPFGSSGTINGMLVEENANDPKKPETLYPTTDEWDCYNYYLVKEGVPDPVFYYGGPGSRRNPRC